MTAGKEGKIKVTITAWYTPEPESYPDDHMTMQEMADQDAALWIDDQVGVHDILDWCDEFDVQFEAGVRS